MKNYLIVILCLNMIYSCKSQDSNSQKKDTKMVVNNTLNIPKFKKSAIKLDARKYRMLTGKVTEKKGYLFENKDKTIVITGDDLNGFDKLTQNKDTQMVDISTYHKDSGKLMLKGTQHFSRGFKKGIWYRYDNNGELVEEINYDKPYKYNWEDILSYLQSQSITPESIVYITRSQISKTWTIEWNKSMKKAETIIINSENGKIISVKEHEVSKEI